MIVYVRNINFIIVLSVLFFSFETVHDESLSKKHGIKDSLTLEKYKNQVKRKWISEADSLEQNEVDSVFLAGKSFIEQSTVTYSPDSTFKIYTIVLVYCGAYCNSQWFSWVHFNLNKREIILEPDFINDSKNFKSIYGIHKLPDGKFLVIEKSSYRPASVLSVYCQCAKLISFSDDSMQIHPILYNGMDQFNFCQEVGVETEREPYIWYNDKKCKLEYYYGNNDSFYSGEDIDVLKKGYFKYKKGMFVLKKEKITVHDKRNMKK
jgi:hypothetical protein